MESVAYLKRLTYNSVTTKINKLVSPDVRLGHSQMYDWVIPRCTTGDDRVVRPGMYI